jgi:phenylpyruvate tautomerase PptA (4-oxalocrotonate tautomerase family)
MPICTIEGPAGLSKPAKEMLIRKTLTLLVDVYQMPESCVSQRIRHLECWSHPS